MPKPTAPFAADIVRAALAQTRFVDVRYVPQTTSTNGDAQVLLGDPAALGATLVADYQTAGSGRKGRRWFAPAGAALLFSTILPRPLPADALWSVPFWTALGVARGVERACGLRLDMVWPNDLYARGRKAGGILSIARITGANAWAGCGVGLNVVRPRADPDLDALDPPPMFLDTLAPDVVREAVLIEILRAFDESLTILDDPGGVVAAWERRAQLAGTTYRYRRDDDGIEREGRALRIGTHGELIVRDTHGEHRIDMADVRIVHHAT